jgi:ABC-type taurine transport system ATPase subunit
VPVSSDGCTDIREDVRGWQHSQGYIPQHIFLTVASVRRNVAFGRPTVRSTASAPGARWSPRSSLSPSRSVPVGLDTVVEERGIRLSGGQRQRNGITRALYHNPPVLVMDEASSAVDNETEGGIIAAVEAMRGQRTIIMIAHRLTKVMLSAFAGISGSEVGGGTKTYEAQRYLQTCSCDLCKRLQCMARHRRIYMGSQCRFKKFVVAIPPYGNMADTVASPLRLGLSRRA